MFIIFVVSNNNRDKMKTKERKEKEKELLYFLELYNKLVKRDGTHQVLQYIEIEIEKLVELLKRI